MSEYVWIIYCAVIEKGSDREPHCRKRVFQLFKFRYLVEFITASNGDADILKVHFVVFNLAISCARIPREWERGLCILILGLHFMLTALEFAISRAWFLKHHKELKSS